MYTLVIPVYRNRESLPELIAQFVELSRTLDGPLEVVFVVDGSPDASYAWLRSELPKSGLRAKLILLSRNFGSFAAVRAGLAESAGPYYAVIAADLQEPPELAAQFFRVLASGEADVVIGTREGRADPLASRLASSVFWGLYRRIIQPQIPAGGVDLFGCNRAFRDHLVALEETNTSLVALLFWLGFRRKAVPYVRKARPYGKSAWSFRRKLKYLSDSVFSFSDLPVRLLFFTGTAGLLLSLGVGIAVVVARVTGTIQLPGYAPTVLSILFFGALNTFGLGIVGAYAWRAFENTKRRPSYVVMTSEEIDGERS
ncbi:MAG: glycosyltransferase family 2 protein [Burkholderiaceae bacterium]|nr:glycosyltransferase family 2 protein [Burkholderiaceae bacterium]